MAGRHWCSSAGGHGRIIGNPPGNCNRGAGEGTMAQVTQLAIEMENKPGALAALCSALAEHAVNITGFLLCPAGAKGPVRLVVSSVETARRVCQQLGLQCKEEKVLAVQCASRPGALGRITRKLSEAGINVEYG